jgi:predicted metalloprotease with PDZ domain
VLQRLERHGPAEAAGLMVGDELIALADQRLRTPEDVALVLAAWPVGSRLTLAYARDGRLRFTELELQPPQPRQWLLQRDPEASAMVLERRRRWLHLEPEPA